MRRQGERRTDTWLAVLAVLLLALGVLFLLLTWLILFPKTDGDGGTNDVPQIWRIISVLLSLMSVGAASMSVILFRSGSRLLLALILLCSGTGAALLWLIIYAAVYATR